MQEEYFDIVDENNNLTNKRELRLKVHSSGLWHRVVHIYFFRMENESLEFLVHLRSKTKDLHPNAWDTRFGGHVKSGESVEEAVVKEVKEETGIKVELSKLVKGPLLKSNKYPNNEFNPVFFYQFDGDKDSLEFQDEEVQEVKWMAGSDIINSMTKEPENWAGSLLGFKNIIDILKNKLK